jgi:signal-transduction protein with cAMP-binding, CBS, and nucleotidyltransferase domain
VISPAAALTAGIAGAMAPPPPALPASAPLSAAVEAMREARCSALLALGEDGRPIGILTEQDIARRVVFRLPPEAPLSAAMTSPLIAARAEDPLWRAIALLRAHRLRHLPVLDSSGACIGLLHRAETLAATSGRLLAHLDLLSGDDAAVKRGQAGLAAALLDEGLPAADVVALVSEVNLDLHRRALAGALAAAGRPPVPFTLLVMGSLGRGESLLRPDQDNGLILGDYPDDAHGEVDAWFRPFAAGLNDSLAAAGFPLCKGGVMARNPLWRKRLPEWEAQFALWAAKRSGAALLFADIAFDFRAAATVGADGAISAGRSEAAARLRRSLSATLARTPALLGALAAENAKFGVGLTLFGSFRDDEPGPGTRTDLKLHGLMPLVAAARLSALKRGVAEAGTPARLSALAAAGAINAGEAATLSEAFATLLDAVLRQQLADLAAGREPGNLVDTDALPREARNRLRAALKAVRSFSQGVWAAFSGRPW